MNEKVTGLVLVGIVCSSQVLSALTSRIAMQRFDAPFFLMWMHTLMMTLMWPLGLVAETIPITLCCDKNTDNNNNDDNNNNRHPRNHDGIERRWTERIEPLVRDARERLPRMLCLIVTLFYPLWVAANYSYVAALRRVPASTMVSIFGSCTAFVSVEEGIWLKRPFTVVRVAAVLFAFGGVIAYGCLEESSLLITAGGKGDVFNDVVSNVETVTAVDDDDDDDDHTLLFGVLLGTCSSLAAATYKVAFKRFLGCPTRIDVCLFLSVLGIVNGAVGAVPMISLARSGSEQAFYDSDLTASSWGVIWAGSVFILIFNASIAFGIAVTSPLFIAVGTVLTIPITDAIDYFFVERGTAFVRTGQVFASMAIMVSFLLIVLFDEHSVVESESSEPIDAVAGASVPRNRIPEEDLAMTITADFDEEGDLLSLR